MQLEYIASGTSHTRFSLSKCMGSDEALALINNHVLDVVQGVNDHQYGLLFNAYTEKRYGPVFHDHFTKASSIHADSGGLQVMTLGRVLTEEVKEGVYETQSKYSDVAMSFDEIPVQITQKAIKAVTTGRFFDKDIFEEKAKRSGYNLAKQIEYFDKVGSNAKAMLIIQGNGIEWFKKWTEIVLKEVPQDMWKKIAGVSISSSVLGGGLLESVEQAAAIPFLPCPDEIKGKVHLLGVGSIKRLFPFALLYQSGFLKPDHLSYDSTSHTIGLSNGTFISKDGRLRKFGKHHVKNMEDYLDQIVEAFPFFSGKFNLEDAVASLATTSSSESWEYFGNDERIREYHAFMFAATFTSVQNMTYHVSQSFYDQTSLLSSLGAEGLSNLQSLLEVNDESSFNHWMKTIGSRYIQSQRIPEKSASSTASLDDLF